MEENTQEVVDDLDFNDGWGEEEISDTPDEDFDNVGVEEEAEAEEIESVEEEPEAQEEEKSETKDEADENTNESEEAKVDMMTLKYNHEEKDYTVEEVKAFAQKGMNYDKMVEKVQNLENSPSIEFVANQAKENNMSVDEYIQATVDYQKQIEVDRLTEKGTPEDIAKELVEKRYSEKQAKLDQEKAEKANLTEEAKQKQLDDFIKTFPDEKVDDIPSEVFKMVDDFGISLTDAMFRVKNQQMVKEMNSLKQKLENKSKAPLKKGVTEHGTKEVETIDPDLDGWDDTDY